MDVRQYIEDYTAGNTDLPTMARGLLYVVAFKSIRIDPEKPGRAPLLK